MSDVRPETPPPESAVSSSFPPEIQTLLDDAARHYWLQNHQQRDLQVPEAYRVMVKGEGCHIYDIQGNRYLDVMGGLFLANIGHGRAEVADAVADQLKELAYVNSGAYATPAGIRLARKLADLTPGDLSRSFFCSGGSEGVEIALKMARQYQHAAGRSKKTKIIARRGQYHGSTYGAMSLASPAQYGGVFEPHNPQVRHIEPPYCYRCPWGLQDSSAGCCMQPVKDLERLIKFEGADTIAAFIATPIPSGNQIPPAEYWPAVKEILDKHEILLIADEVICGFGRLGTWFGMEQFNVQPDIMVLAKALTGGYLPGGAVMAGARVAEVFETERFNHGVTFGGHPGVMAAGLKTIEIMERENLVENSRLMGDYLYEKAMAILYENHPTVGFVGGGMGLLMTIEMVKDRQTREQWGDKPDNPYAEAFSEKLRRRGISLRAGNQIVLSPPLTIDRSTIDDLLDVLDECITELEKEFKP
ncbi:MAG: aspartate aminotransferase family protein [Thermaerobacterales bacterium]